MDNKLKMEESGFTANLGHKVLKESLVAFGIETLKDADEYFKKPACSFDHIPSHVSLEILCVVEKLSAAREIVEALSTATIYPVNVDKTPVYSFHCKVSGRAANVWMISTNGHICKQKYKKETNNGTDLYAEIVDVALSKSPTPSFFKALAAGCDAIILALDNDHAGEAISFNVVQYLIKHIKMPPSGNRMDAFFRARFSSSSEIVASMGKLDRLDFRRYLATVAKSHLDLRAGVLFRECQKYAAKAIPSTITEQPSLGPCSAPCLALIVDRYHQALSAPTKYCIAYKIFVNGKELYVQSKPFDDEDEAKKLCALQKDSYLNFCEVIEESKRDKRVTVVVYGGLNTSELLQEQSKYYGRSAAETSKCTQKLYEMGLITYPRSASTKYPENMKVDATQLYDNLYRLINRRFIRFKRDFIFNMKIAMEYGRDKGSHPPIMPTAKSLSPSDVKQLSRAD